MDGYYLATVPELPGVITQSANVEELFPRVKEAIEAYLEAIEEEQLKEQEEIKFVGVNQIEVDVG